MTVRVRVYGDTGLLLEPTHTADVLRWQAAVSRLALPGVLDVVPAARTVLIHLDPTRTSPAAVAYALRSLQPEPEPEHDMPSPTVEISVTYDGPDLAVVADLAGLTEREVVAVHTGQLWSVAFCGFAPGFAYLTGSDPRLRVPRRATPRQRVPAGAVALAGEYAGIYPRVSPGGWQLIGRTDRTLWDLERDPPALLAPGTRVRFVRR